MDLTAADGTKPWMVSDTSFPAGTDFMADYKGEIYSGVVKNGKLTLNDSHTFSTPPLAVHITGSNVDGWRFWKCKLPGALQYVLIERLREKAH